MASSVEAAQEEVNTCYRILNSSIDLNPTQLRRMKADLSKRTDKAKQQKDTKYRETPDIVVKVNCRYRAELFFKISRKAKVSRLITSWTERMEFAGGKLGVNTSKEIGNKNGFVKSETASTQQHSGSSPPSNSPMQFIFTFNGRSIEANQTFEEIGIDDDDEILAVELMDLTEGGGSSEEWVTYSSFTGVFDLMYFLICFLGQEAHVEPEREKLKKNWTKDPQECAIFFFFLAFFFFSLLLHNTHI